MPEWEIIAEPPLDSVRRLLAGAGLPSSDIDAACLKHFLAGRLNGGLAGIVGLEPHGSEGLIRSLVVRRSQRGAGLGRALLVEAEHRAGSIGVRTLYLLTNTAQSYFHRLGYRDTPRDEAPASIRSTAEFSALCPDDAAFMCKRLQGP